MRKVVILILIGFLVVGISACGRFTDVLTYDLSVSSETGGVVYGTESGSYKEGAEIALTAAANSGYKFLGWYAEEELLCATKEYSFFMPAKKTAVNARFAVLGMYSFEVLAESGGIISGTESGSYEEGTGITLAAAAEPGYKFNGWFNEGNILLSLAEVYSFAMPDDQTTVIAKFSAAYELKSLATVGGKAFGAGFYSAGETVSLTAEKEDGYNFTGWYEGEYYKSHDEKYTFKMPERALAIKAVFSSTAVTDLNFRDSKTEIGVTSGISYTHFSATIPAGDYRLKLWRENEDGNAKIDLGFYISYVSYSYTGSYNGILEGLPAGTHTFTLRDLKDSGENICMQLFSAQPGESENTAFEFQYGTGAGVMSGVNGSDLKYVKVLLPAGYYKFSASYASGGPGINLAVLESRGYSSYYFTGIAPYIIARVYNTEYKYITVSNISGTDDLIDLKVEAITPGSGDLESSGIDIKSSGTQFENATFNGNKVTFFSIESPSCHLRFFATKNGEYADNVIIILLKPSGSATKNKDQIYLEGYLNRNYYSVVVYDFYNAPDEYVLHIEEYMPEPGETAQTPIELTYSGEETFSQVFEGGTEKYYAIMLPAGRYRFSAQNDSKQSDIYLICQDGYETFCYLHEKMPSHDQFFMYTRTIIIFLKAEDTVILQIERL